MADPATESESSINGTQNGIWIILFVPLFIGLYIAARMFWVTEPMEASRLSMGVLSRVDGPGFVLIGLAVSQLIAKKGMAGFTAFLVAGMAGIGMIYFSYFGAIDIAAANGPDLFWKAVVSEQGCFPSEWIPVAENRGLSLPSQDQLCGRRG